LGYVAVLFDFRGADWDGVVFEEAVGIGVTMALESPSHDKSSSQGSR
jgi:hypothetical protein